MTPIKLTADEWELYSCMAGSDTAAKQLNKACNDAIESYPEHTVENMILAHGRMLTVLDMYSEFGAYDTEPRLVLRQLLSKVYENDVDLL